MMPFILAATLTFGLPAPAGGISQCSADKSVWIEAGGGCHSDPRARTVAQYWWSDDRGAVHIIDNPCWHGRVPCMSAAFLTAADAVVWEIVMPDGLPPGALGVPIVYCLAGAPGEAGADRWSESGSVCHSDPKDRKSPECTYIDKDGNPPKTIETVEPNGDIAYSTPPEADTVSCRIPKGWAP